MYSLHDGLTKRSFINNQNNKQLGWNWLNTKQPAK